MSGIQVTYNWENEIGKRVTSAMVLCASCDVPHYGPLEDQKTYKIILPAFLLAGGDGFIWTNATDPIKASSKLKTNDVQAAIDFISSRSPIYSAVEGRITIEGHPRNMPHAKSGQDVSRENLKLTLISVFALAFIYQILIKQ